MNTEINWNDVIKKEARGNDALDLGAVQEISEDKAIVQKGILEKNIFRLPKSQIKSYAVQVLQINNSENVLKNYGVESSPLSVTEKYLSTRDINSGVAAVEEYI